MALMVDVHSAGAQFNTQIEQLQRGRWADSMTATGRHCQSLTEGSLVGSATEVVNFDGSVILGSFSELGRRNALCGSGWGFLIQKGPAAQQQLLRAEFFSNFIHGVHFKKFTDGSALFQLSPAVRHSVENGAYLYNNLRVLGTVYHPPPETPFLLSVGHPNACLIQGFQFPSVVGSNGLQGFGTDNGLVFSE